MLLTETEGLKPMEKIYYNKLIRDRIPLKIARNGGSYKLRK